MEKLKELQEYKKLCEPVRVGPETDFRVLINKFKIDKSHVTEQSSSLIKNHRQKSGSTMLYGKLGQGKDLSQPILKISKKKRLQSARVGNSDRRQSMPSNRSNKDLRELES